MFVAPRHSQRIVTNVLSDPELKAEWLVELKGMADRINGMRSQLVKHLKNKGKQKRRK